MSGLTGAINIALTGIDAFEQAIGTVSQNVANQTTPGYAVETAALSTIANPNGNPAGLGVQSQVTRAADGFATTVLRSVNTSNAAASTSAASLAAISDALMNNGDVQPQINQFFEDISTLSSDATSTAQRQTVLSDAQSVVGAFQSAAGAIATAQAGSVTALQSNVSQTNGLLSQLATINQGLQASPNDPSLLDQQEAALSSLSSLLPVTVVPDGGSGQILVATGGTMLLNQAGAQSLTLQAGTGEEAPSITVGPMAIPLAVTGSGGAIGGAMESWQAGASALQNLNGLAAIFASTVNTAQAQGLTPNGAEGSDLFSVPAPTVAAASGNAGDASLSAQITDAASLPVDGGPFTLSYNSAAGWTAVDQASQQSYSLGQGSSLSFAGMTVAISGTAADGDSFTLNPAPGAAAAIALTASSTSAIAAADPYVATPGALQPDGSILNDNAGTIAAGSSNVTDTPPAGSAVVPPADFGQSLQIAFTSPTAFTITSTANPSTVIAAGTLSGTDATATIALAYPGSGAAAGTYWQIPISGEPAAGDVMSLTPGSSGDGTNATRMQGLWTEAGTTASGSLEGAFLGLSTSLGANAQQASDLATATAAQVTTATTNLQTVAGVDTNQQAVLLSQYEQAYQSAAKVIAAATDMFQSLLDAVS